MRGAEEAKRLDRERTQLNAKARQACETSKRFHALACSPQSWSWKKSDSTPDALRASSGAAALLVTAGKGSFRVYSRLFTVLFC